MKRSTRRALAIQARTAERTVHTQESFKLARYVMTSVAQGDPTTTLSIGAILMGGMLKVAAAASRGNENFRDIERPLDDTGKALWAVAAVNEAGGIIGDIAQAMRGQQRVPVTYDVTDTPHTLSTSVSNTSSGLGGLNGLLPAAATAATVAAATPAAAAAASAAGAVPTLSLLLASGGAIGGLGYVIDQGTERFVSDKLAERGMPRDQADRAAGWATLNRIKVPAGTDLVDQVMEAAILAGVLPARGAEALSGGRTAGSGTPIAYLDGVPYYSSDAVNAAIQAATSNGRTTVINDGKDANGAPRLRVVYSFGGAGKDYGPVGP